MKERLTTYASNATADEALTDNLYFVRIDLGSYAKEFKSVVRPTLSNTDGVKVLTVTTDDETYSFNWDKINCFTIKENGGK